MLGTGYGVWDEVASCTHILCDIETSFKPHLHVWYLYTWKRKQCVPLKHWLAPTRLHAVVTQETTIWTFTTLRTSNTINVKFYMSAAWRHIGEAEVQLHSFLTSALGVQWLISCPDQFTPEKEPKYPSNRRLGGPQSQSRCFEEQKNLLIWTPEHSHYTNFGTPARPSSLINWRILFTIVKGMARNERWTFWVSVLRSCAHVHRPAQQNPFMEQDMLDWNDRTMQNNVTAIWEAAEINREFLKHSTKKIKYWR
jgi:hypothetical protein